MAAGGETIPEDPTNDPMRGAPAASNPDRAPGVFGDARSTGAEPTRATGATTGHRESAESSDSTIERTQKVIAVIQGALEGLQEALERENLGRDAGRAYAEVRDTAMAVRNEARAVGQDPAMRRAGAAVSAGASAVSTRVSDTTSSATHAVKERATHAKESIVETKDSIVASTERVVDDVKAKAAAVKETGIRAKAAPGRIVGEYKQGVKGYASRMGASLGLMALAGALGITFLVIFAIWLTVGLNAVLGDPLGTLVSALIFALLAGIVIAVARSRAKSASESMDEARRKVREEIEYVKRPVATEFGQRRGV